jgi:predicted RNase H-like HicB family nuclease
MKHKVYILLTLSFSKDKKTGQWIGECVELGTSTFGNTIEEVSEELPELVKLHLNTLEQVGERDNFLKENGITIYKEVPSQIEFKTSSYNSDVFMKPFKHQLAYT